MERVEEELSLFEGAVGRLVERFEGDSEQLRAKGRDETAEILEARAELAQNYKLAESVGENGHETSRVDPGFASDQRAAKRPSRTRRARPLPAIFFSAEAHALERPRDGGVAHLHRGQACQQLAPLRERGGRAFLQVALEEPLGRRLHLAPLAGWLARGEAFATFGFAHVAFDRREANTEGAGDLRLGCTGRDCLDDLLTQVFGVRMG